MNSRHVSKREFCNSNAFFCNYSVFAIVRLSLKITYLNFATELAN